MDTYAFSHNQDKINETIDLIHIGDNVAEYEVIGNIYNLIEYINNSNMINSKIIFVNFKINQMNYVLSNITRNKNIDNIDGYNSVIISDKKRKIRGKIYDKMD